MSGIATQTHRFCDAVRGTRARILDTRKTAPNLRATDFYRGLIDTSNVAFFLAGSVWFLVLATLVLQSRRWR